MSLAAVVIFSTGYVMLALRTQMLVLVTWIPVTHHLVSLFQCQKTEAIGTRSIESVRHLSLSQLVPT